MKFCLYLGEILYSQKKFFVVKFLRDVAPTKIEKSHEFDVYGRFSISIIRRNRR
jgi:hypothetical protein